MVPCSAGASVVEQDHKTSCHQLLSPQAESQLPPASPGGSAGSASGADPGAFQTAPSALALRVCEMLCAPFRSRVSASYSPLGLPNVSSAGFQSQIFWSLNSWCRTLGLGSPTWGSDPSLPREGLCSCDIPPPCGSTTQGCGS